MIRFDKQWYLQALAFMLIAILWIVLSGCCTIHKARHDSINAAKMGYIEGYMDGYRDLHNRIIEEDEQDKLEGI